MFTLKELSIYGKTQGSGMIDSLDNLVINLAWMPRFHRRFGPKCNACLFPFKCSLWLFWPAPSTLFTLSYTPGCADVNIFAQHPASHSPSLFSNPYAFPSIALFPQVILLVRSLSLPCTLIIPDIYPRRFWWPLLRATATQSWLLAYKGDSEILSFPSPKGFSLQPCLLWDLWAFWI